MSIVFDQQKQLLTLTTTNSSYQIHIDQLGFLHHLYYGSRTGSQDMSYQHLAQDVAFSGNPVEYRKSRDLSLDIIPQEYTSFGIGDYRLIRMAAALRDFNMSAMRS